MTAVNLPAMVLLAIAFISTGAAWCCTVLIDAKVIRSTALPYATLRNLWSEVAKAYPVAYPGGRLLFWRALLLTLAASSFVAMVVTLMVGAILSKLH